MAMVVFWVLRSRGWECDREVSVCADSGVYEREEEGAEVV